MGQVVLVDTANVIGSRPDGWWRDRPAATRRLLVQLESLVGAVLPADGPYAGQVVSDVVVVLEGQARRAAPTGSSNGVDVRHADGSGDDALVALVGAGTLLITADRELARRAEACGATVAGPRWLLDQLS